MHSHPSSPLFDPTSETDNDFGTPRRRGGKPKPIQDLGLDLDLDLDSDLETESNDEGKASHDARFSCNICLEPVQSPVATLCGHLYCWPCLYRWLEPGLTSEEMTRYLGQSTLQTQIRGDAIDRTKRVCPVCKAPCGLERIVPIYIRSDTSKEETEEKNHKSETGNGIRRRSTSTSNQESSQRSLLSDTIPLRPQPLTNNNIPVDTTPSVGHRRTGTHSMSHSILRQSLFQALVGLQVPHVDNRFRDENYVPPIHRPSSLHDRVEDIQSSNREGGSVRSSPSRYGDSGEEYAAKEFLSRLLLMLASFVLLILLLL